MVHMKNPIQLLEALGNSMIWVDGARVRQCGG